jgi:hypothetical protein
VIACFLAFAPFMETYSTTLNVAHGDLLRKSASFLSELFILFTGALSYLHFNYLFFNHSYDKLTMYIHNK